jgi:outer membrane lipoprotein carrier protein
MTYVVRLRFLVFILALLFLVASASAGIIDELKARQKNLKTVKAAFSQEKHTELLRHPIRSKGVFYFKSQVGVRWQYDEMTVIYDGKTLYIYYPELEEAERLDDVSGFFGPLSFDIESLLKGFSMDAKKENGRIYLTLKPKRQMPFQSMEMMFPAGSAFPEEVKIKEETGDITVIKFKDVEINVPVPDELFVFTPPAGVKIRQRQFPEAQ